MEELQIQKLQIGRRKISKRTSRDYHLQSKHQRHLEMFYVWTKHGKEFPEYQNAKQYAEATHTFVNNPPAGTLTTTRKNGDTIYYNQSSNTFAIKNADGVPKTMFRPHPKDHGYPTNLDYFNAKK